MSSLRKDTLQKAMPPLPEQYHRIMANHNPQRRSRRDYSPSSWDSYFEEKKWIEVNNNKFQVYCSGKDGPALILLHGGGHSALTWALFTKQISLICSCQVMAIDLRGHGNTETADDEDLKADTLARDVADVISTAFDEFGECPEVVLLGHSMGGAIAVHAASNNLIRTLSLMVVIDVVEGTALDSLSQMISFLRGRPSEFKSLEHAIEWSVRSGQIRNMESAKVSMPGQLVKVPLVFKPPGNIPESKADESDKVQSSQDENGYKYTWRIDLTKTEKFWKGWFQNMSELFLSCKVPKILLLAGVDRLDKALTVGQMQGKFQMQVLPNCGHTVHEDLPEKVAEIVASVMIRHRLANPKSDFKGPMPAC